MDQKWALFSLKGRLRRRDYWLYSLPLLFITIPVFWYTHPDNLSDNSVLNILSMLIMGFVFWASIALNVKRLHDRNKSALWVLLTFVPLIGPVFVIIELGMLDGTKGPNQYGLSPKFPSVLPSGAGDETVTIEM
ncbi:DUF805 domain-containing protein [Photobacterium lipolyticum]|uniref:DUF805 domain-containing protein n=1 Tax=Photobacterium lipolyticum TaxID=266810 RepID=A0A2T3N4J2_9GAMM|nr:DUF805 domain-containing protein [Photobacterium lipolyticum]PSW07362.1 DUF805 domain-containing protein [Photobacterium lipolyticum]